MVNYLRERKRNSKLLKKIYLISYPTRAKGFKYMYNGLNDLIKDTNRKKKVKINPRIIIIRKPRL